MLFRILPSLALLFNVTTASYAFYVGKSLTADGSVMVGGTGEEVSSHWLEIFPAKDYPPNTTLEVGVTEQASMPGRRLNISQAAHTFRYISMEYSDYEGFPAPLTNGGVNEKGVAVRDVWAQNRDDLIAMTPNPQTGLQYSDLARIVMERASSAREGVEIIGQLISEYGYADYGGNSHLIADANEGWIVWEMSGGKKLWAAERLGTDVVRVLYPGYIENFPVDFENSTNYMGSPNIVSFAVEQGWWNPNSSEPFNVWKAYGTASGNYTARDGGYKYMSQAALENATLAMAPVTEKDLIARLRDFRIADDEAGYGQVVSLHPDMDPDLIRIWVAPTGSVTAPFNPWWLGVKSVPSEYGQHRYLTADAASTFLDPDFQSQEATDFACRIFKQVLYYTCSDPDAFLPIVQDMLHGFENASFADLSWVERSAELLVQNGQREDALDLLTFYAHTRAEKALALGKTMVNALDAYIKLTGRFRGPSGKRINDPGRGAETVNCLVGWDPDQPPFLQTPMRVQT
ncbi:hypothetical protein E8E13_006790 [Curvularia kusanoi]|uniref:Dipeptidase domain containing protein n=1 Tax=Curvularia kusanoi TaxID=90978 RepID=A0A9P4W8S1_CURKU|nr:hypothetical protein E8E13_006790 [Curvularia kusanoi]